MANPNPNPNPNPNLTLADVQNRLNADDRLRQRFLEDPAGTLRDQGMDLTPEMERSVGYLVDQIQQPGRLVPGAGIAPPEVARIRIRIVVDF